ncbi:MAG: SDR family oxidoreductase [bacterium]
MTDGKRLVGKTVMVSGAAQGMGRQASIELAQQGATVFASDLQPLILENLGSEIIDAPGKIHPAVLDVTNREAVEEYVRTLSSVDVLFNCAGYVHQGTILDCELKDWQDSFRINVDSMFYTISAILPKMVERKRGSIINMASICGSIKGIPNRFAYGASKAAVIGITKSIAAYYVGVGIRCNAIAPGTIETPSLHQRMTALGDFEEAREMFTSRQPMGRLGQPEDVMPILIYLASDESNFTTGQVFNIDGGITI